MIFCTHLWSHLTLISTATTSTTTKKGIRHKISRDKNLYRSRFSLFSIHFIFRFLNSFSFSFFTSFSLSLSLTRWVSFSRWLLYDLYEMIDTFHARFSFECFDYADTRNVCVYIPVPQTRIYVYIWIRNSLIQQQLPGNTSDSAKKRENGQNGMKYM